MTKDGDRGLVRKVLLGDFPPPPADGVYQEGDHWGVYIDGQRVASERSSEAAWRRMDRLQEQTTSPSEARADYGWRMRGPK